VSDAERFDAVLTELGHLLVDLKLTGVDVVLIGGQVISVEALTAGRKAVIAVETPTGVAVQRGYSMEPDLLFDVEDAGARGEAITEVLKSSGFSRVRDFRWGKRLAAGDMLVDLFVSSDVDDAQNPGGFARLPRGDLALSRAGAVHPVVAGARLDIKIPDPVGFLSMKIEAKDRLRPTETKDSFDIYAYVSLKGAKKVGDALRSSSECAAILGALRRFFAEVDAPGVRDVVSFAGSLEEAERDLLARAVVDLFDELHRIAGG
jgi:hypothetical protein